MQIGIRPEFRTRDSSGKVRPLWEDTVSMGTVLASNVMVLHSNFQNERAARLTVVDLETGEAIHLLFGEGE